MKREKLEKIVKRFENKIEKNCKKFKCSECKVRVKNDDGTIDCPLTHASRAKTIIVSYNEKEENDERNK